MATETELIHCIYCEGEKRQRSCKMHVLHVEKCEGEDGYFRMIFVDNAYCRLFPKAPVKRLAVKFFVKTKTDVRNAMRGIYMLRKGQIALYEKAAFKEH